MHILVIDDSADDRTLMIRELRREFSDLQIEEVRDAASFEQALAAGGFDVVITDYRLRWSNGLEILHRIKERFSNCPVIMFTNTGTQELAVEAMKNGLDDYILKSPKHYIRLRAAVRAALEKTATQQRATRLEHRLHSLLDRLKVGVFRATPDRQLLEVNQAFLQILDLDAVADLEADRYDELFAGLRELAPQQSRERELQVQAARGGPVWVSLNEMLNILDEQTVLEGIMEDVTGRKRAEQTLKRFTTRLQTLQDLDRSILQAISPTDIARHALDHVFDLIRGQLLDVTLFDFEQQQATVLAVQSRGGIGFRVGQQFPLAEFGDIEQLQRHRGIAIEDLAQQANLYPVQQQLAAQGVRFFMQVPIKAQEQLIGSLNVAAVQPGELSDEEMEIAHEVANQLAIAIQQARLREALQRYNEQLEQLVSDRTQQLQEANNALEVFAYSISHDLREPLRVMQGYAQILLEDYANQMGSEAQDYTRRIVANAERMDALLQDLLAYSRLSRVDLPLQVVNLTSVVQEVLNQLEPNLEGQQVQLTIADPLLNVMGHYLTLVQVVLNLVTNAIKFVAADVQPRVRIWTERIDSRDTGRERRASSPAFVRLWVEDNGIGIDQRSQERIFQVFERLHGIEAYPGNGIGLAIVFKAIERLGGRVGVESAIGEGSRFWIELREATATDE